MPGGDGTGPVGRGSMTGRGLGYCAGFDAPGFAAPGYGRGFGRGWGRGYGRGYWGRRRYFRGSYPIDPYYPSYHEYTQPSKEQEKTHLEGLVKNLEEEIKAIHKRIKELSEEQ